MNAWHEWQHFPVLVGICLLSLMILTVVNVLTRGDSVAELRGETTCHKLGTDASPAHAADKFFLQAYEVTDDTDNVLTLDQLPDPIARMHDRDEDGTHETLELLHEGEITHVFVYDPERGWKETTATP